MDHESKECMLAQRLESLGYGYCADDLTHKDGRRMIFAIGCEGYAVDRLTVKEAADWCNQLENL